MELDRRKWVILCSCLLFAPYAVKVRVCWSGPTDTATTHLEVVAKPPDGGQGNLQEQVLACLVPGQALTRAKLRDVLSVQNQRLGEALETLERASKIRRSPAGWQRVG